MKNKCDLSLQDVKTIERLTEEGIGDADISRQLQVKRHVIQRFTSRFWDKKMKKK